MKFIAGKFKMDQAVRDKDGARHRVSYTYESPRDGKPLVVVTLGHPAGMLGEAGTFREDDLEAAE